MATSDRESLSSAQSRAPSPWVGGDLVIGREARRGADGAQSGRPTADADRHLRWADAAASLGGEEALDDTVLERVVGEDGEPATGR